MSQLKTYPATCASCGQQFQARLWSSINVTLHPPLEALLLSGRLNLLSCPRCSTIAPAEPPLLYHEMEAPRAILALSRQDRERAEEAKQAIKADFEEMKRLAGGEEALPSYFAEPQVVFGYSALAQAIWPETALAPALAPAAAPTAPALPSAPVETRRKRLSEFTPEDVRRLTQGFNLACEAVTTAQVRAPSLRMRMHEIAELLTRHCLVEHPEPAGLADTIYQWLGNAYFHGWLDARALWQCQFVASGQPPSADLGWLWRLGATEVEQAVRINENAAEADIAAAQASQALKDWRSGRLDMQSRRLAGAGKAIRRKKLEPLLFAIAQRAYTEGFAEGALVENFLAEAGLPFDAARAAAPVGPQLPPTSLPPKPLEEMTVQEYLECEISRLGQARQEEISAGLPQDLLTASRQKERTITCTHCGYKSPLRLWSTVNITTHSYLRSILRDGKIHQFRCAGCGSYGQAEGFLHYYDAKGPLLVQVYPKHYEKIRTTIVSEFESVLAYIQALPPPARPKDYPASGTVLFGMDGFADFLRRREPESPPLVTGRFDGEGLMALNKETFAAATANLDSSISAWRDVLASSGPLQRLRQHRVWYVVRGAQERVQSTQADEAAVEKVGLAVGAICFLGFGDGRHLYHYEWARRGDPPAEPGPWLAAFTDPEIVHAVHKEEENESDEAWGKAFGTAPTVQAWQHDFLASQAVREAVHRLREGLSAVQAAQPITKLAEQAYDRSLVLAMLLAAWLRGA